MGWKDVAMPQRVARRPRDKRGFPVPWLSEWKHPTRPEGYWNRIRHHSVYGPYAGCAHVDGVGTPDLGQPCPAHQIKGMAERRCGVCGDQLPASHVYWLGGETNILTGYTEPPLHLECALYACQVCPALVTTSKGPITVVRSKSYAMKPRRRMLDGDNLVFDSLEDPLWQEMERLGRRSFLVSVLAIPEVDVETWPVRQFLEIHSAGNRARTEPQTLDCEHLAGSR